MKIHENQKPFMTIKKSNENHWKTRKNERKSLKFYEIYENQSKSMTIYKNR